MTSLAEGILIGMSPVVFLVMYLVVDILDRIMKAFSYLWRSEDE